MEYLLFFIAGYFFAQVIMPFVLELLELIITKCGVKKMKYTKEITTMQINMEKELATVEELKTNTRVIGFGAPEEEYMDEEEDNDVEEEPENED